MLALEGEDDTGDAMFRTPLEVCHAAGDDWELTAPLVFEGKEEYFVIRPGFRTDFASIPRPLRWIFDSGGHNSEAGVLHDALWRESKLPDARVDAWDADGLFRRALRLSGATAPTRGLMWVAVRAVAILSGRFGKQGPPVWWKVVQILAMTILAVPIAAATVFVFTGMLVYWLLSWLVAPVWHLFERTHEMSTNWPWPVRRRRRDRDAAAIDERDLLIVVGKTEEAGRALAAAFTHPPTRLTDDVLEAVSREIDLTPEKATEPSSPSTA